MATRIMRLAAVLLVTLTLAGCSLETGPAGGYSIGGRVNLATGEVNTSGGGH